MNALAENHLPVDPTALEEIIARAAQRIAPTWPLDQFIAVNPYWGFVDQHIDAAAAQLGYLSGALFLMPRAYYLEYWEAGYLRREHLEAAIEASGAPCTADLLIATLHEAPTPVPRLRLIIDLVDAQRDLEHAPAWRDFVTHQISQHCAAYFDASQATWKLDRSAGLYATWQRHAAADHSAALLMGFKDFARKAHALPSEPLALIATAIEALGVPEDGREAYFTALLLSINGWAAWCAYERWQARLAQGDDDSIVQLLAIRLAWEWLLYGGEQRRSIEAHWTAAWRNHRRLLPLAHAARDPRRIRCGAGGAGGVMHRCTFRSVPPRAGGV
jgi:uncharacterized protein YbcC (UPF0753/DUF2309 family)